MTTEKDEHLEYLRELRDWHEGAVESLTFAIDALENPPVPEPIPEPIPEPTPEPDPEPAPSDPVPLYLWPPQDLGALRGFLRYAPDGLCVDIGVNPGDVSKYADEIKATGFRWVRTRIYPPAVESSVGRYNWTVAPNYDRIVYEFNRRGIGVLFYFQLTSWVAGKPPYATAEERADVAGFCQAAALHFRGTKVMFELGNEPNIPNFWPINPADGIAGVRRAAADYAALAQAVIPAMRIANPNVFIMGPGLAGRGGPYEGGEVGAHVYMRELRDLGALELFDAMSVHLYTAEGHSPTANLPRGRAPEDADVELYREIIGPEMAIVCTEQGWKAESDEQRKLQAAYNVRDHIWGLYEGVRFHTLFLWGGSPGQSAYFLAQETRAAAIQSMSQALDGYDMTRRIDTGNADQFVFEFANADGAKKLVGWKRDETTDSRWESEELQETFTLTLEPDIWSFSSAAGGGEAR